MYSQCIHWKDGFFCLCAACCTFLVCLVASWGGFNCPDWLLLLSCRYNWGLHSGQWVCLFTLFALPIDVLRFCRSINLLQSFSRFLWNKWLLQKPRCNPFTKLQTFGIGAYICIFANHKSCWTLFFYCLVIIVSTNNNHPKIEMFPMISFSLKICRTPCI